MFSLKNLKNLLIGILVYLARVTFNKSGWTQFTGIKGKNTEKVNCYKKSDFSGTETNIHETGRVQNIIELFGTDDRANSQ